MRVQRRKGDRSAIKKTLYEKRKGERGMKEMQKNKDAKLEDLTRGFCGLRIRRGENNNAKEREKARMMVHV